MNAPRTLLDLVRAQLTERKIETTNKDIALAVAVLVSKAHVLSDEWKAGPPESTSIPIDAEPSAELKDALARLERAIALFGGPGSDFAKSLRDYLLKEPETIVHEAPEPTRTLITRDEKTGELHTQQVPQWEYEAYQRQRAETLQRSQPAPRRTWSDSAGDVYRYLQRARVPDHQRGQGWLK